MKTGRRICPDILPLLTRNDDICNLEGAFQAHLELADVNNCFFPFPFDIHL